MTVRCMLQIKLFWNGDLVENGEEPIPQRHSAEEVDGDIGRTSFEDKAARCSETLMQQ